MDELQIKDMIRGVFKSMASGDNQQVLSFMTEDTSWKAPHGTFKGTAQIDKYLTWVYSINKDYKITENGIGIIVQGNTAVAEHELSGIYDGLPWSVQAVCIWEFKEGKIEALRTIFDVLAQVEQLAKGGINKVAVNSIINASRKGLVV
ncbi:MAG: nuclear transport factor 2 family protein [Pseudomonadota bacterium]